MRGVYHIVLRAVERSGSAAVRSQGCLTVRVPAVHSSVAAVVRLVALGALGAKSVTSSLGLLDSAGAGDNSHARC
jgi:hypothetical protein